MSTFTQLKLGVNEKGSGTAAGFSRPLGTAKMTVSSETHRLNGGLGSLRVGDPDGLGRRWPA
jgi:hypothetical protein